MALLADELVPEGLNRQRLLHDSRHQGRTRDRPSSHPTETRNPALTEQPRIGWLDADLVCAFRAMTDSDSGVMADSIQAA